MKKPILFIILFLVMIISIGIFSYFKWYRYEINLIQNQNVEIYSQHQIKEYIKSTKNIEVTNLEETIDTSKLGKIKIIIKYKTKINNKEKILNLNIVDTTPPVIVAKEKVISTEGETVDLLKDVEVSDNSKEDIQVEILGEYNLDKSGEYLLKYVAKDSSGNETQTDFTLIVNKKTVSTTNSSITTSTKSPYYIKINRKQNVVMIYSLKDGEYSQLEKVFTCSTGTATPVGTFTTTDKYTWRALFGGVYGQYATRITGSILFHSVPYTAQRKDTLEYDEYNKLGTEASLGCIRLRVIDAKWIYDNCPSGTTVTIYDSDSLDGIEKPDISLIDTNSPNRGWDPTDPDPNNPWSKQ